jgi:hypothetical protein
VENATVEMPMVAESQESQPLPPNTAAIRTALLAHGELLGTDPALIRSLSEVELASYADVPAHLLPGFLGLMMDTADRHAGRVPLDDTAAIHCEQCGPVWINPSIAAVLPVVDGWPRALGCPWCFVRKAGGYVPRPPVTCGGCRHFTPDTINPPAGMGVCGAGNGTHWPMQRHACGNHSTRNSHDEA